MVSFQSAAREQDLNDMPLEHLYDKPLEKTNTRERKTWCWRFSKTDGVDSFVVLEKGK